MTDEAPITRSEKRKMVVFFAAALVIAAAAAFAIIHGALRAIAALTTLLS